MVTLSSAENALKTVYLGVVANQLNLNANPLLAKIKQSTKDVWGKEIKKLAPFGINGGIGAGSETGTLPTANSNNYVCFTSDLKNLYGKIEISDKAIRASASDAGAFVNLLNDEMEGLIKASSFNLGRMLYGDGTGLLCSASAAASNAAYVTVDSVKNLIEGLVVDVYNSTDSDYTYTGKRITYIDRANKRVYFGSNVTIASGEKFYVQGSKDLEIDGIGKLFSTTATTLYGLTKTNYPWLKPSTYSSVGTLTEGAMQNAVDDVADNAGSEIDFIACSSKTRRKYQSIVSLTRTNFDYMEIQGGFKAISFNGIPVVADRFIDDGDMFMLNTKDFCLHELCDWKWLEGEDGKILKQNANYATYAATLVKYANLICDRPCGQAKLSGITVS